MGAWSTDVFGNDTACDWAYGLEGTQDLSLVESALEVVLAAGDDYLEAPEAEEALAAGEVIARLQGNWGIRNAYSEAVDTWVEANPLTPSAGLVGKAQAAIDRILAPPSELLELWQESDELDAWRESVMDLRARL
jgi:hypothetical protein